MNFKFVFIFFLKNKIIDNDSFKKIITNVYIGSLAKQIKLILSNEI